MKSKQTHHASKNPDASYQLMLEEVRKELPRTARPFSRFIHFAPVERLSDIVASTIARPSSILAGGIIAFTSTLAIYSYAKFAGFSLQGSETIIAFMVGWAIGILYDLARRYIFRKS